MRLAGVVVLAALLGPGQDKPAAALKQIVDCVRAGACPNMTPAQIHWYDSVNIPVLTFKDGDSGFSIAASRQGGLSVWMTMPGESRPSRLLALSADDHVLSAELGPMPGDRSPQVRMTPAEMETWARPHKAFNAGESTSHMPASGQEFKAFGDEQAKQAMAAIRRQVGR